MTIKNQEFDCSDAQRLLCYLVDYQANVIASNQVSCNSKSNFTFCIYVPTYYTSQDLAVVELGERLGSVDPQLMQQLVKTKKLFETRSEHNYQVILCKATLNT